MNNNKILTIGAVFIMIVAAFTGVCFVSEEADAAASDDMGYFTLNLSEGNKLDLSQYGVAESYWMLHLVAATLFDESGTIARGWGLEMGVFEAIELSTATYTLNTVFQADNNLVGRIWHIVVTEDESKTYSHTVSYNSDGGSSVSDTVVTDSNSGSSSVTLASAPTKSGYTFNGWKIGSTVYAAGATVSVAADSTVTATAQWTENKITVNSPSTQYVVSGNTVKFTASASANTGSPTISYSVSSVPDGFTVTVSGSTVTIKCPTVTEIKDYTFTLTASASGYTSSSTTVTVHLVPVLNFLNTPAAGIIIS